jgi:LmeA-like phospholipid-binding
VRPFYAQRRHLSIYKFGDSRAPDGGATMSYEPTQPMTPPSTSLTDDGGEDRGRERQEDPGQDEPAQDDAGQQDAGQQDAGKQDAGKQDAGQDDAAQAAAMESDSGQVTAPEGGVSQATIPRAVLSQASVPAPASDAQPHAGGQGNGPQGGWAAADGPQDDASQSDAPQGGGWEQGPAQRGYTQHGDEQQSYGPQGYAPQGYGPQGYGPQGDWDRGNAEHGYGPQGYGPEGYGPQDYGPEDGPPPRPRRRRRPVRRSVIALFIILVIAIVLVIANFVGQAIAENDMASQFTANGFPVKPSVDIEGFPFLTQVASKDFKKVVISASNIPAGPVTISSLNATITGMHLNSSWNGATIDHVTATAFVSLSSLTDGISSELGDVASLTAVPDGANKLKVTGSVLGVSASGDVEIKQTGPQQITIELPTTGGLVGTLLGSAASFTITLPAGVPPSLRITGLTINGQGLTLSAAASNATFSK